MQPQLIAIDADALQRMQAELEEIKRLLLVSNITPPARWITIADYAKRVGKSEATVRRWIRMGQLERKQGLVKNPDA